MTILRSIMILGLILTLAGCGAQTQEKKIGRYGTWPVWEVDRVASIWLIKRYIDKDAEFVFVEKDAPMEEGLIPLDVPESDFRRQHNLTCYQVLLKQYGLSDPKLEELGRLTWDIEINFWGEKKFPETLGFKKKFDEIFDLKLSPEETLEKSFIELDAFIKKKDRNE